MAIAGTVGFAMTVPIGRFADRYGPRNVLLALSFVLTFGLRCLLPSVRLSVTVAAEGGAPAPPVVAPMRNRPFVLVTAANGVLFLHDVILIMVLPLWVANHTSAPI